MNHLNTIAKILRAIIYLRVSTGQQAEKGTSLEDQMQACTHKAQDLGAEVIDIITDPGISGALFLARPGIQKTLALIETGEANCVIALKLDRSGRDTEVLSAIRKRVLRAGGQLIFADGANFENNATGNLLFNVNASFAQYEREVIRERTAGGRRRRAEQGQQPIRVSSPYGYHVVNKADVIRGDYPASDLGSYQVIEAQAQWVREIFYRFAAGDSLNEIATWMHYSGVPTPKGAAFWRPSSLRILLTNPVYKGEPAVFKTEVCQDENRVLQGMKLTTYRRARESADQIVLSAPAFVDAEIWETCQERLRENKARKGGNPTRRYPLSTLLRCPRCGHAMHGIAVRQWTAYRCCLADKGKMAPGQLCSRKSYSAQVAKDTVINGMIYVADHPEALDSAVREFNAAALQAYDLERQLQAHDSERRRIEAELKALQDKEETIAKAQVEAMLQGRSTAVYDKLLAELDTRRKTLQEKLKVLPKADAPIPLPIDTGARIKASIDALKDVLRNPKATGAMLHELLSTVIKEIVPSLDGQVYDVLLRSFDGNTLHSIRIDSGSS